MSYSHSYSPSTVLLNESFFTSSADSRVSRNFEQLITERGTTPPQSIFTPFFETIKDKLFLSSETEHTDLTISQINYYTEKYNVTEVQSVITRFKQKIAQLYTKLIEHGVLIEERRRLFNSFCNSVSNSVKCISEIVKDPSEKDIQLRDLLNERTEWYYKELEMDALVEEEIELVSEFDFLKQTLADLSGLSGPTLCSICMENQVSWFIDPCGHTLCKECKIKTEKMSQCHYCREQKMKYGRLYL